MYKAYLSPVLAWWPDGPFLVSFLDLFLVNVYRRTVGEGNAEKFGTVPNSFTQKIMWKPVGTLSGAVCPLPPGTP